MAPKGLTVFSFMIEKGFHKKKLFLGFANNKGADMCSLISAFVFSAYILNFKLVARFSL